MLLSEEIVKGETWTLSRGKLSHLKGTYIIMHRHKKYSNRFIDLFQSDVKNNRWLLQPIEQFTYMFEHVTVFEDFQGIPLKIFLEQPLSLTTFFQIAEELVNACVLVHQQGLLLQQMNPMTIFIHPKTHQIKLLPTNSLSRWGIKTDIENDLYEMMFMAPEQLTKINIEVDERADLYALGAIFYTMLVGPLYKVETREQLMFQLMTKAHSLSKITEKYGQPKLQAIIEKLLAKNPNERYRTAYALKKDLKLLQQQKLTRIATADDFMKPQPNNVLVGREQITSNLRNMLKSSLNGEKQFTVIHGQSGVGKTSLVYSLQQSIVEEHGYLIECKFEEIHEHQTILFVEPFRQLCKQLYFRGETAIEKFKQQLIINELTPTKNLLQILPELQLLIDGIEISQNEKVFALQQHHYLLTVFQKLLSIFTALNEPIVLLLDDCQWADSSVVGYFEHLYKHHQNGCLFIIATIRTVNLQEPVFHFQLPDIKYIALNNLNEQEVTQWIASSIQLREDIANPFAKQFYQYTNGNPFYMKKLFVEMLSSRAIYFDIQHEIWRVNSVLSEEILNDTSLTQFLTKHTSNLSDELLKLLQISACIGYTFSADTVMYIANYSIQQWQRYCEELVEGGYILSKRYDGNDVFQFIHGSIQETIYNQMDPSYRQNIHYRIGKYFLGNQDSTSLHHIISQFNLCVSNLDHDEKLQLLKWNIELAEKSFKTGLYAEALKIYVFCKSLLPQDCWHSLYEQTTLIYKGIGECSFLVGDRTIAEQHLYTTIEKSNSKLEKLETYLMMIYLYMEAGENEEALAVMHKAFMLCHITLPLNPSKQEVYIEYIKLQLIIKRQLDRDLSLLHSIENKEIELLLKMNSALLSGSFRLQGNLMALYLFRAMRLTLKYGVIEESAILFLNYALVSTLIFCKVKQGECFSDAALRISENVTDIRLKSRVYFLYASYVHFGNNSINQSFQYLEDAQKYASQFSVHSISAACSIILLCAHWHRGIPVKNIYEIICAEQQKLNMFSAITAQDFLQEMKEWVECLRNGEKLPVWNQHYTNNEGMFVLHHIYRMQMSYLYNNETVARSIMNKTNKLLREKSSNILTTPYYYLYDSLWSIDFVYKENQQRVFNQLSRNIKRTFKTYKQLSTILPQKYEHLYLLLCAEDYAMKGKQQKAILVYDHAIQIAQIHHYTYDLALLYERASKFYRRIRDSDKSIKYLLLAIKYMEEWGAPVIANMWKQRIDHISLPIRDTVNVSVTNDLYTVVETAQVLAKEIKMEKLIEKLLFVLLKQVNATSCYFLMVERNKVQLKALLRADFTFEYMEHESAIPQDIQTISQFVLQCKETVLINNVQTSSLFNHVKTNVKSMLCTPIYYKGEIIAIIYLENEQIYNAFNEGQLQMIELIAMQTAVSIENAKIYEELEDHVIQRTQQLEETNHHLIQVNEELARNETERQKLLQSVSHELRSPITSTIGYIEAILDGLANEEKQEFYLQRSKQRLIEMKRLIDDVFDLTKLEAGRTHFEFEKINVLEFLYACISSYQVELQSTNLNFEASCAVNEDVYIHADASRFQQVMNNILVNAIKYTNEGTITFRAFELQDQVVLEVQDTGIGISEQDLPFIFDLFYYSYNTKGYDSNGIGLAICKQIVLQHDGEILVESKLDEGSVFRIILPMEK